MVTVSARSKKALLAGGLVLGILLLGLLCFYNLGVGELCDWDEARHAVSAYEMIQTGEPVVTTYEYSSDYWNLKPPLSEWFIALGYKVFGCNTVGLRFYSAVSMFLAALAVAAFLWRRYGRVEAVFSLYAFMAVSTLFSYHAARHGDADALFILCDTLSLVCLCEGRRDFRWVYGACLAFSFAFLAKGFHAGTIAVTVLLMLLLLGYFPRMKFRQYALCALCSLDKAHTYIANHVGSSWDGSGWNGTEWRQVQLAEAEWLTDCTPRQGGIAAFEKDPGSYLIVVNSRLEELAQYPVVAQTEHYSLLSNS